MNRQAYDFLNSARVLHWNWLRLKAKHDELESCLLPAAIRYDKDKIQASPEDAMSKIAAEVIDLEKQMAILQRRKAEQVERIDKALKALESDEERTALTMRYINRVPVPDIAKEMGYSTQRIYQFMDKGGAQIAKRLKD